MCWIFLRINIRYCLYNQSFWMLKIRSVKLVEGVLRSREKVREVLRDREPVREVSRDREWRRGVLRIVQPVRGVLRSWMPDGRCSILYSIVLYCMVCREEERWLKDLCVLGSDTVVLAIMLVRCKSWLDASQVSIPLPKLKLKLIVKLQLVYRPQTVCDFLHCGLVAL